MPAEHFGRGPLVLDVETLERIADPWWKLPWLHLRWVWFTVRERLSCHHGEQDGPHA